MRRAPIRLDLGETSFAPPPGMADFVCREISRTGGAVGYGGPQGDLRLRKAIALWREQRHDDPLTSDSVLITVGASGGIAAVFAVLMRRLKQLWLPEISFPTYRHLAAHAVGYDIRHYADTPDGLRRCAQEVGPGSGVVIVNPQNPQGDVFGHRCAEVVRQMKAAGAIVVADASFEDVIYDDDDGQLRNGMNDAHRITDLSLHSFSKAFCLAGWRIGYVVIRNEEWRRELIESNWEHSLSSPMVSQWAALYCLAIDYPTYMDPILGELRRRRDWALAQLPPDAVVRRPVSGYFLWLRGSAGTSTALLEQSQVVTVAGTAFGSTDEYFRVNLAASLENLEAGLDAIAGHLRMARRSQG